MPIGPLLHLADCRRLAVIAVTASCVVLWACQRSPDLTQRWDHAARPAPGPLIDDAIEPSRDEHQHAASLMPSPDLSPVGVVTAQLRALQSVSAAPQPGGADSPALSAAWRFASPSNREAIGSIEQFEVMLRSPEYALLLAAVDFKVATPRIDGDQAALLVRVVAAHGEAATYGWTLSRQRGGEYDGCWLTDAVVRLDTLTPAPPSRLGPLRV